MRSLKKWDYYRKTKDDLEKPTFCGALLSIITLLTIAILAYSEYCYSTSQILYKQVIINSEYENETTKMETFLNVTFLNMPCGVITFTTRDLTGKELVALHHGINYTRLTNNSLEVPKKFVDESIDEKYHNEKNETKQILTGLKNKEKCRVIAHIYVNRVPGRLIFSHILREGFLNITKRLDRDLFDQINFSHNISALTFGSKDVQNMIQLKHGLQPETEFNTLQGIAVEHSHSISCDYYLKVIPFYYQSMEEAFKYSFHQHCFVQYAK